MRMVWKGVFCAAVLILAQSCFGPAETPPETPPDLPFVPIQRIDETGNVGTQTAIAVSGNNVYISYLDETNTDVKVARSADGGYSWTNAPVDSAGTQFFTDTGMAVSGGAAYVSYGEYLGGASYSSIQSLAKTTDGGTNWVTSDVDGPSAGYYSSIAANGNSVYLAYYENSSEALRFSKSTDGGDTWGTQLMVDTGSMGSYPAIAVSGSYVYVSYYDAANGHIKVAASTDGGQNWSKFAGIDATVNASGRGSSICASGLNIYVSYFYESGAGELRYAVSSDGGATWDVGDIDDTNGVGQHSSITLSNGALCVSYSDGNNGDLMFARSVDGGTTWTTSTIDSLDWVGPYNAIAADGDKLYVSYYDETSRDLKLARSRDGGLTW